MMHLLRDSGGLAANVSANPVRSMVPSSHVTTQKPLTYDLRHMSVRPSVSVLGLPAFSGAEGPSSVERVRNRRRLPPEWEEAAMEQAVGLELDGVYIVPFHPDAKVWESLSPHKSSMPIPYFGESPSAVAYALESLSPVTSPLWSLTRCSVILSRQALFAASHLTSADDAASAHRHKRRIPPGAERHYLSMTTMSTTVAPSHDVVSEPIPRRWLVIGKQPMGAIYIRRQPELSKLSPRKKTLPERQREYAQCLNAYRTLGISTFPERHMNGNDPPAIGVLEETTNREALETTTQGMIARARGDEQAGTQHGEIDITTSSASQIAVSLIQDTLVRNTSQPPFVLPESIFFPASSPLRLLLSGKLLPWRHVANCTKNDKEHAC